MKRNVLKKENVTFQAVNKAIGGGKQKIRYDKDRKTLKIKMKPHG